MARQLDELFSANQPQAFVELNDRLGHVEYLMDSFRPNLELLRLNQEAVINQPAEDIDPQVLFGICARIFNDWQGPKNHDYHEFFSLQNILQSLVASSYTGPALRLTISRARQVILAIFTSWSNVRAAQVSKELTQLGLNVAPLPVNSFRPRSRRFQSRGRRPSRDARF